MAKAIVVGIILGLLLTIFLYGIVLSLIEYGRKQKKGKT